MAEYRPEPTELWQTIQRHWGLVRRLALAVGGAMLGYGAASVLRGGDASVAAGCMAIGGGLVGFFAPRSLDDK